MSTTTTDVDAYAAGVREALADLPAADRDDLLADLEDHLAEVAAEGGLEELLGSPEAYAAELRSSAGLPPPVRRPAPRQRPAWLRETLAFLPELRPGWWVVRGLLVAWFASLALGGAVPLWLMLAVPAVPASVLLGRRAALEPRLRWVDLAASIASVVLALLTVGLVGGTTTYSDGSEVAPYPAYSGTPGLDGVSNLFPYSSEGKPLDGVQLYDQDGNPVELVGRTDQNGNRISQVARRTTDGRVVNNVFPQQQTVEDPMNPSTDGVPAQLPVVPPAVRAPVVQPR